MSKLLYDFLRYIFNKKKYIVNSARAKTLPVLGGQIEYCRFGGGSPIVLIIGYAAGMNGWDIRFLNELAAANEVIVFNNRNVGRSINPIDYTVEDMANDVELLRTGLNLGKISVCGISLGGVIAQQYAFAYPENLESLILINSFPPGDLSILPSDDVQNTLRNITKGTFTAYWKMMKLLFPSIWQELSLILFSFKRAGGINLVSSETILQQQSAIEKWINFFNPESFLKMISAPTLILVGRLDELLPPQNSILLKKYLCNAELMEFSTGGHIMIYQNPVEIAQAISGYRFKLTQKRH